ncbi:NCS2 family nucleobase:cation symporter-2 [Stella humosa]|uniref:NCS2 family nucleobase:cation symporter-2 n=1 Tax=Stella humosa TaxID=94 RepID=A0A3N1KY62_9PROT|nr:solute carrier family 23 protein [Stella humosa]ROP83729.1 NCS2 family nucleobase:cation symporter-2 [Stella humosa]
MTGQQDHRGYSLDDRVPLPALLFNAVQHVAIIAPIGLVFPGLVARAAGLSPEATQAVVAASLIALGLGSLLLCRAGRLVGSGFLAPAVFTAAYLPASLAAAALGGLPLVIGMTIFAGLCELLFSFVLYRMRTLLPGEISGLAVLMIGITLALLGFRLVFDISATGQFVAGPDLSSHVALGLGTLALIIALNVWGRGPLRVFAVLIGVAVAYAAAAFAGRVEIAIIDAGMAGGLLRLPRLPLVLPAFDLSLAPPFMVGALAAALRAMGDITTCQRMNDRDWVRPDFISIQRGVRADGLATILSGCLGSVGLNTFSGSIGLAQASGVTARRIGPAIAGLFVLLAFFPPVIALAAAIPQPVTGAVLMFSSAFIIASGLQIIVARLLDARRILAIGLAFTFGVSHAAFLGFYTALPTWLATVSSSALVVALVIALSLNAIFRIGTSQTRTLTLPIDADLTSGIHAFCDDSGAAWGARRDVVERVFGASLEAGELALANGAPGTPFQLSLTFDEFFIDATASYELGQPPPVLDAEDDMYAETLVRMADLPMLLIHRQADRVAVATERGRSILRMRFDS